MSRENGDVCQEYGSVEIHMMDMSFTLAGCTRSASVQEWFLIAKEACEGGRSDMERHFKMPASAVMLARACARALVRVCARLQRAQFDVHT